MSYARTRRRRRRTVHIHTYYPYKPHFSTCARFVQRVVWYFERFKNYCCPCMAALESYNRYGIKSLSVVRSPCNVIIRFRLVTHCAVVIRITIIYFMYAHARVFVPRIGYIPLAVRARTEVVFSWKCEHTRAQHRTAIIIIIVVVVSEAAACRKRADRARAREKKRKNDRAI